MKRKKVCFALAMVLFSMTAASCAHRIPRENTIEKEEEPVEEEERDLSVKKEEESLTVPKINSLEAGSTVDIEGFDEENISQLFYAESLSEEVLSRINGISYHENPYISTQELRYLRVLHCGFDGETHIGELIVNERIAQDILEIMRELYEQDYPIEKMILVDAYNAEDEASMSDNNTSAFNYRVISGSNHLSGHGKGMAVDINPKYNPFVRTTNGNTVIEPANGADYADREKEFPYKIDAEDLCCKLFKEHGFTWGGDWRSLKDYQHFQKK